MPGPNEEFKEAQKQQEIMREKEAISDAMEQTYRRRNIAADNQGEQPELVHDTKRSFSILKKCKKFLFPASAGDSAEGMPAVEQHKEKNWKDKRADEAHAEEAKKETQDRHADAYSYEIMKRLKVREKSEEDSLAMYRRTIPGFDELKEKNKVDIRVIRCFTGTYKTDEKGMPIDQENAELMDKERKTMEAYVSGDLEKRKPILENLVKELMDKRIEPSMLNIEYVAEHIVELKNIGDKMIYLENIMNDEINKPFFEAMEPVEKEMLECTISIADVFTGYLDQLLKIRAVNMNLHSYIKGEEDNIYGFDQLLKIRAVNMNLHSYIKGEEDNIEAINMLTAEFKSRFDNKMAKRASEQQKVYEKYYGESVRKLIKDCANPTPDLTGKMDEAGVQELKEVFSTPIQYMQQGVPVMRTRIEEADRQVEVNKEEKITADAQAKVAIGIRTSSESSAKAYKKAKGTLFDSLATDYKSLMKNLQQQDLPYEDMLPMVKRVRASEHSGANLELGGGAEALSVQILQMFRQRITSDAGIDFLKANYEAFGKAKVFDLDGEEKRLESFITFQMQCLINNHVSVAHDGVDANTTFGKYATAASRNTLGIVRVVADSSPADLQKLKNEHPGAFEVAAELISMIREVTAKLKDKLGPEQ